MQVHGLGSDIEQVAPGPPGQLDAVTDGLPERAAEPGYVRGQAFPRLGRWPGIPQPVNEGVGRHGGSRRQQEYGENAAFPGRPKIVLPVSRPKLNRPEDPKFHDGLASSTACGLAHGWSNGRHGTITPALIPIMAFSHSYPRARIM